MSNPAVAQQRPANIGVIINIMNYKPKMNYSNMRVTFGNRKRQIQMQQLLDTLHTEYLDMIDAAVELSDLSKANEIIDYIRAIK